MNRLAVFVEGHTEVVFVRKLIEEIAGRNNVLIKEVKIFGGSTTRRRMETLTASRPVTKEKYFVLIVDCGGDVAVKTRIIEEHQNLTDKGYSRIIGLRDVAPTFTHPEIPKLESNLAKYVKTSLIPVEIILAIMEIEAWFLAEATHFSRIDPAITVAAIKKDCGFDPETDDMAQRAAPAKDLHACYAIAGKAYKKDDRSVQRTVNALDYARMYLEFRKCSKYFGRLVDSIDAFLLGATPGR